MPRILAVANRKGGVGKTTTTVNVATAMAAAGKKVLVIDLDPQGNASTSMGVDKKGSMRSSYDVLLGNSRLPEAVVWTEVPNFSMVPSSPDLAAAEIELIEIEKREFALKKALQRDAINYDYILIDCSPSLGLIMINALTASDSIIIPVQCEFFALEGIAKLLNTIKIIKSNLNPNLRIEGFLLTMYDGRLRLSAQVHDEVRRHFGDLVFNTVICRNVRLSEAPSHGVSVLEYDRNSKGAKNYISLAKELIRRHQS
jgi:chromosome partitioning protein